MHRYASKEYTDKVSRDGLQKQTLKKPQEEVYLLLVVSLGLILACLVRVRAPSQARIKR